jgi:hypothetical protein
LIDAPIGLVWEILTDFENYGLWNSFCPRVDNTSLEIGSPVAMLIDLGKGPQEQVEYIERIIPEHCIAWRMRNAPEDTVHAVRSQFVNQLVGDSCSYYSVDQFYGPDKDMMMKHYSKAVEDGFNRCAIGLKKYAEQQYQKSLLAS